MAHPHQQGNSAPGERMYALVCELFPITRSITGNGVRETLKILQRELPNLQTHEVPSGTECFDWTVPPEWNVRDAFITGPDGKKFAELEQHNLHLVGYSEPVTTTLDLSDLQAHLHSLPGRPNAIPYVTSYYKRNWGFCLPHNQRQALQPGAYDVHIDSTLDETGHLTYGEYFLPSTTGSKDEIFLSTYICHPSMANNELSGPVVATALANWLAEQPERRFGYRFVFIPETIGAIVYLSRNLQHLQEHTVAGFNISCVGDDNAYSYLPSRLGKTVSDDMARHVLDNLVGEYIRYTFLDRGSDERQYCAPGVDLPVASIMRSKFGAYDEYHTSDDNLDFISPAGLNGGFEALRHCLIGLEANKTYKATVLGEPQLGKYGLYPSARKAGDPKPKDMLNILAYSDGQTSLLDIARHINQPIWNLAEPAISLHQAGLLEDVTNER